MRHKFHQEDITNMNIYACAHTKQKTKGKKQTLTDLKETNKQTNNSKIIVGEYNMSFLIMDSLYRLV